VPPGILALFVVLRFLRLIAAMRGVPAALESKGWPPPSAAIAFAAVALNPALVGTSAQATNDAFVILFASLTICSGARVLAGGSARDFSALILWAILADLWKGNGLVATIAVATTFAIVGVVGAGREQRRRAIIYGGLFVALVAVPVALNRTLLLGFQGHSGIVPGF
jgi:hypothetical protein